MTYDQLKQKLIDLADKNQEFFIGDVAACLGVSVLILTKTCYNLNINVNDQTNSFCGYKKDKSNG